MSNKQINTNDEPEANRISGSETIVEHKDQNLVLQTLSLLALHSSSETDKPSGGSAAKTQSPNYSELQVTIPKTPESLLDVQAGLISGNATVYSGTSSCCERIDLVLQLTENRMKVAAMLLYQRVDEASSILMQTQSPQAIVIDSHAQTIREYLGIILASRDPHLQQQLVSRIAIEIDAFNKIVGKAKTEQIAAAFDDLEKKTAAYLNVYKGDRKPGKLSIAESVKRKAQNSSKLQMKRGIEPNSSLLGAKASIWLQNLFRQVQGQKSINSAESIDPFSDQLFKHHNALVFSMALQEFGLPKFGKQVHSDTKAWRWTASKILEQKYHKNT